MTAIMALRMRLILITLFIASHLNSSFAYSTKIKDKESLKGAILRASAFEFEPVMMAVRQGNNVTYTGVTADLTNLLAEYLGMRLEYVRIDPKEYTKLGGGVASAQQIARKEIDIANYPAAMNLFNSKLVDLSFPVWSEPFCMLQPFPEEESRLLAPIRPFSDAVWLFFILSALVFIGIMSLLTVCNPRPADRLDQQETLVDGIYRGTEYVITIVTSQGNSIPYDSCLSMKILTGSWLLAMIVLINAYAGLLTAYLTVPKRVPTVETFEDLANRPGWSITVDRNNDLSSKFMTATSGPFKVLGDQLRRNPDLYITDPFKVLINVVGPRAQERLRLGNNSDPFKKYWNDSWNCYVLNRHQPVSIASFYISSDLKKSGQCRTTRSIKPLLYMTALCYGFPKDSEIKELANQRFAHYVWQMGYVGFVTRKYFPVALKCRVDTEPQGKTSPFKLADFISAFFILGIGLGLSVLIFQLELVFSGPFVKKIRKSDSP